MVLPLFLVAGWLLLMPPEGAMTAALSQPLIAWEQVQAFESATACEGYKAEVLTPAEKALAEVTPPAYPSEEDQREWLKCQHEGYGRDDAPGPLREAEETEEERSVPPYRRKPKITLNQLVRQIRCEGVRESVTYYALPVAERSRREARLPALRATVQRIQAARCVPSEAVYPTPDKRR